MNRDLFPVHEVFASIQGEGAFVGESQVFVRLEGCPLRCTWCDTPRTWRLPHAEATLDDPAFAGERAWVSPERIADWVERVDPGGERAVSLTGGEPLMWPELPARLKPLLGARRLHLETAGAFPEALAEVLPHVDHVSADLKLPADLAAPVPLAAERGPFPAAPADAAAWTDQRRAVLSSLAGRDACLKLVVAAGRALEDFEPLLADAAELAPASTLFLQPVTPRSGAREPGPELLESLTARAARRGLTVRVQPQLHVSLGLR